MAIKLFFSAIVFSVFVAGCQRHNANAAMDRYFESEISKRITFIGLQPDSLQLAPSKIDKDIRNLILMTRDVENLKSATSRANLYFRSLAVTHRLNPVDFTQLDLQMELNEMASLLKQNELNFFNLVIFKSKAASNLPLFTAQ